jgi:hypothetical protein
MSGGGFVPSDGAIVDVLSLTGFKATLDARLSEAIAVRTTLTEQIGREAPKLGNLPDADYVGQRYLDLYDQHLDRIARVISAIEATQTAITTIIDNYETDEALRVADARRIADALGDVSGVPSGDRTNAG